MPPRAGVLSVDLAGPLKKAPDLGKGTARFVLSAAFTWPTGAKGEDIEKEVEEEPMEGFEDWEEPEEKEAADPQKPVVKRRGRP